MSNNLKNRHHPLDIYLAEEVSAAHSLVSMQKQQMQALQHQVDQMAAEREQLITSIHRLEMIALEESYRQEALEEVVHRMINHTSPYVAANVIAVMQELSGQHDFVTDDIDRMLDEHGLQREEDRTYRETYEWLFNDEYDVEM